MLKSKNFPKKDIIHRAVISAKLMKYTVKSKKCKKCKYYLICDGLWKKYAQIYGDNEIIPKKGKKIKDPTFFLKK